MILELESFRAGRPEIHTMNSTLPGGIDFNVGAICAHS